MRFDMGAQFAQSGCNFGGMALRGGGVRLRRRNLDCLFALRDGWGHQGFFNLCPATDRTNDKPAPLQPIK